MSVTFAMEQLKCNEGSAESSLDSDMAVAGEAVAEEGYWSMPWAGASKGHHCADTARPAAHPAGCIHIGGKWCTEWLLFFCWF